MSKLRGPPCIYTCDKIEGMQRKESRLDRYVNDENKNCTSKIAHITIVMVTRSCILRSRLQNVIISTSSDIKY